MAATVQRHRGARANGGLGDRRDAREPPFFVAGRGKSELAESSRGACRRAAVSHCRSAIAARSARARSALGRRTVSKTSVSSLLRHRSRRRLRASRTLFLELERQLLAAGPDDAAVRQHVDDIGHDVVQQALVVRDDENRAIRAAHRVHAVRDDLQRVDVEPGVGLVEDRQRRLEHRHLKDLVALLLAAGEAFVDRRDSAALRRCRAASCARARAP